jgi:hypothetical protein
VQLVIVKLIRKKDSFFSKTTSEKMPSLLRIEKKEKKPQMSQILENLEHVWRKIKEFLSSLNEFASV